MTFVEKVYLNIQVAIVIIVYSKNKKQVTTILSNHLFLFFIIREKNYPSLTCFKKTSTSFFRSSDCCIREPEASTISVAALPVSEAAC